ncbi:hypothetical protein BCR32DRAFT_325553 [Anaeromyces robustus]|uniref:Mid2 domain-containing protein n=1 Tax=Anaeromyces robustus TaxID=1754192 RepID=A0A1Y1XHJ8_9FUNG|nr:hypothetical protein BCR32DRAFT_325553 [Anaeromyces robustus]|eukprot:ORX85172.1 hypothetical protein BCR32DRAFT_325553 [Anaeromyces robustus]
MKKMNFITILLIFINILQVLSQDSKEVILQSMINAAASSKQIPAGTLPSKVPISSEIQEYPVQSTKTIPTKSIPVLSYESPVQPSKSIPITSQDVMPPSSLPQNIPVTTPQVTVMVTTVSQIVTNGQTLTTIVTVPTPVINPINGVNNLPGLLPFDPSNPYPTLTDANGLPIPSQQAIDPNIGNVPMGNNRNTSTTSNNENEEENSNMLILIVILLLVIVGIIVSDLFFCHRIYVNKKAKRQKKNIDLKVAKQIERIKKENGVAQTQDSLTISIDTSYSDTNSKKALISPIPSLQSPNPSINESNINKLLNDNSSKLSESPNLSESSQNVIDINDKNNNNYNTFADNNVNLINIDNEKDTINNNNNNNNNVISSINDLAAQSHLLHSEQNTNEQIQNNEPNDKNN